MAVESSFIPFPSEVIVPPAAYQACNSDNPALYKTDSKIVNVILVILVATLGALIGALVNYFLSMILGRPIIYWFADSKVGHLLLLNSEKIKVISAPNVTMRWVNIDTTAKPPAHPGRAPSNAAMKTCMTGR